MYQLSKKYSIYIFYGLFFIFLSQLFVAVDLFDALYGYTRSHEEYELDEYLSIFPAILILLIIHTLRNHQKIKLLYQHEQTQRRLLEKQDQKLTKLNADLEQKVETKIHEIRAKDKLLLQQSRFAAMGKMFSMIAHHWRQPLNTLSLLISKLEFAYEDQHLDGDTLRNTCKKAEDTLQELSKSIDDYASLFRSHRQPELFYLQESLDQAYQMIQDELRDEQITFTRDTADSIQLMGVKSELDYVLISLLTNAYEIIQAKNPKEKKIYIHIRMEQGQINLIIGDTGGGIPDEYIERIFDPYFSTKHPLSGTGVGLFIVKNIIEKNFHGLLQAQNTQKGAELIIRFPKASPLHAKENHTSESLQYSEQDTATSKASR